MKLRDALHEAALENPFYGYRRLTPELKRRGWKVGETRIRRLMREDNLLRLRKRRVQKTTDSRHGLRVYPNRARDFTPTALKQLWAADITYIRLGHEFVYAAVILDLFSRRVVGWAVGPGLETELPLAALKQALSERRPKPGLIHHSDQGTQYASNKYVDELRQNEVKISMSRKGNPYDNAFAESFMKTLKGRKSTATSTPRWPRHRRRSGASSRRSTIASGCTRRWAMCPRRSSKKRSRRGRRRLDAAGVFEAGANLSIRCKRAQGGMRLLGRTPRSSPR